APGPKPSLLDALVYRPGRDPLVFFTNLARTYGDVVQYRMAGERIFLISDPQHIKNILVTNNRNFTKSRGLERTKRVLGNGLLTSEGAVHLRQRRLMQPAFHRDRVAAYGATMVAYADRMRTAWRDGARPRSRGSALDAATRAGRGLRRVDARCSGGRRSDNDLPRRPRDDGERADVDVVSPEPVAGGGGEAARGGGPRARRTPPDRRRHPGADVDRARRHRVDAVVSAGVAGRPPRDRGVRIRTVRRAAAGDPDHEPFHRAARRAVVRRPGAVRPGALDAGVQGLAAAVRVLPVRRRAAPLHRRVVRLDGTRPHRRGDRAAVGAAPGAGPSGRPAAAHHAAREARDADDARRALTRISPALLLLSLAAGRCILPSDAPRATDPRDGARLRRSAAHGGLLRAPARRHADARQRAPRRHRRR